MCRMEQWKYLYSDDFEIIDILLHTCAIGIMTLHSEEEKLYTQTTTVNYQYASHQKALLLLFPGYDPHKFRRQTQAI